MPLRNLTAWTLCVVVISIAKTAWPQCNFVEGFENPQFGNGSTSCIRAMTVFDDGNGDPALFVGGRFDHVFGGLAVSNIARFDGVEWSSLSLGVSGGSSDSVYSMIVYNDGGGDALYVGGEFTSVDGEPIKALAKWDGKAWSSVPGFVGTKVYCMTVYDAGSGPELVIGGSFNIDGIVRIAKWNGKTWSGFGSSLNAAPRALQVHDDTGGLEKPSLFATGEFTSAGGVANTNRIAKWNGTNWQAMSTGLNNWRYALAVYQGDLIVGGSFTIAGGLGVNRMAKWNGSAFESIDTENFTNGACGVIEIRVLHVADLNGAGPRLFAGGRFGHGGTQPDGFAMFDGSAWTFHGSLLYTAGDFSLCSESGGLAIATYDDQSGKGPALFFGGRFGSVGGIQARIAAWRDGNWSSLYSAPGVGQGVEWIVRDLEVFDDALYACGDFQWAGGFLALGFAQWTGQQWELFQGGAGFFEPTFALSTHDDGSGNALYIGGSFSTAGSTQGIPGVPASGIAKWDGSTWSALGAGVNGQVRDIISFEDDLVAGGSFLNAGGQPASRVARWDGTAWWPLLNGLNGTVNKLCIFDDGSGDALYVSGTFTAANGITANRVARWKDNEWSALGQGLDGPATPMVVFDDGNGASLYVGGAFATAGTVSAANIAKWDGITWTPVGSGLSGGSVSTLIVHDDDHDGVPSLFAGGSFTTAGGVPAKLLAKWDGRTWTPVGDGLNSDDTAFVLALAEFDHDGDSLPSLHIGGLFEQAGLHRKTSPFGIVRRARFVLRILSQTEVLTLTICC